MEDFMFQVSITQFKTMGRDRILWKPNEINPKIGVQFDVVSA